MLLHYLAEATLKDIERRIPILLKKYYPNTPPEQATKQIESLTALDPTRGKYTEWIIKQYKTETIRIPEDNQKITQLLKQFHKSKGQLQDKDINNYTPGQLSRALDETGVSGRQAKKAGRAGSITLPPGAQQVYNQGNIQVVKITDVKAATTLSSGTDWCTANPEPAQEYLDNGPLYIIYRDGKRYALAHADSEQLVDVYDDPIEGVDEYDDDEKIGLLKLLFKIDKNFTSMLVTYTSERIPEAEPYIMKDPEAAFNYAYEIIKGPWPEAEPAIMKNPSSAYRYANEVIKGPWPEAESTIMKNPMWAYRYANEVIKGPWPEAESTIMKNPEYAYKYAKKFLRGRWPEAEPYIMKNPAWAQEYAISVIRGRWPEAEPYIMKGPDHAYHYAKDVIGGRWPEAEPYIMKSPGLSYYYAKDILKRRWLEAEPLILKSSAARSYTKEFGGRLDMTDMVHKFD